MRKIQKAKSFGIILFCATSLFATAQTTDRIKVNQAGYYPAAPKLAAVTGNVSATEFFITSTNHRDTVYSGKLSHARQSKWSKTEVKLADFSSLQKKGSYVMLIPGVGASYAFQVGNDVLRNVAVASLKGFYYQRMSMPLEPPYAGKWHRGTGHPDNVVYIHPSAASTKRPAGTIIASPGGWIDAGDYNKYIVNSGITMGTLFSAFEDFHGYYSKLNVNIPESGNGLPDILNEALYNLRWMLTMQDPFDGGVYHKCTNAVFDGMVMPGVTMEKRYVVQKSTAAALDFAAVMAQAARIFSGYKRQLPGVSDSCLKAAEYAWEWATKNPALLYDQNEMNKSDKPEVTTGAYGDRNVNDEWLWAAAELFVTTNNPQYFKILQERMADNAALQSWGNVALMGYYSMIRKEKQLPAIAQAMVTNMKDSVLQIADRFLSAQKESAFNTVMGQSIRDFPWGSNAVAANQGMLLVNAWKISGEKKYLLGALSNLDYLLGRNATGYCFITGIGSKSPMHPHHRPSEADGITEPVPGLLVGGPNPSRQDKCNYPFTEPETAYLDELCSYASNEIAINWNAPLVYLAGAIDHLVQTTYPL